MVWSMITLMATLAPVRANADTAAEAPPEMIAAAKEIASSRILPMTTTRNARMRPAASE